MYPLSRVNPSVAVYPRFLECCHRLESHQSKLKVRKSIRPFNPAFYGYYCGASCCILFEIHAFGLV